MRGLKTEQFLFAGPTGQRAAGSGNGYRGGGHAPRAGRGRFRRAGCARGRAVRAACQYGIAQFRPREAPYAQWGGERVIGRIRVL